MKLNDLKGTLIQQFFHDHAGVDELNISQVIELMGESLKEDVSYFDETKEPTRSHEPSKAFAKFAQGKRAALLIEEEEPYKKTMIFGAMRSGKRVITINLTNDLGVQPGSLGQIKEALHQAKALSDDVCFSIINEDRLFEGLKLIEQKVVSKVKERVSDFERVGKLVLDLESVGWKDTHGAMYTNTRFPNFGLDLNSGKICVVPVREKGAFNSSPDDVLEFFDTKSQLDRWMKSDRAREWIDHTLIDWSARHLRAFAHNAKVGSTVVFKEYDHQHAMAAAAQGERGGHTGKELTGKLIKASDSGQFIDVKVGKNEVHVYRRDVTNLKHVNLGDEKNPKWTHVLLDPKTGEEQA
jgi:hypothetical protein